MKFGKHGQVKGTARHHNGFAAPLPAVCLHEVTIARLANRHERTSDLFSQFRERLGLPDPDAPADENGADGENGEGTEGESDTEE